MIKLLVTFTKMGYQCQILIPSLITLGRDNFDVLEEKPNSKTLNVISTDAEYI
jgi:hypothetical protein